MVRLAADQRPAEAAVAVTSASDVLVPVSELNSEQHAAGWFRLVMTLTKLNESAADFVFVFSTHS